MNNLAKVIALGGRKLNRALALHYLFGSKGIPKGYIPLEYIESTGTQYIDLGITSSDDMEFEVDYQVTSGSGKLYGTEVSGLIFDAYNVTQTAGILRAFRHSNTGGTLTNITTNANEKVALKVTVKDGTYSVYINDNLINTAPVAGTPPDATMYLFACNRNGTADSLNKAIIWDCRIKKSGKLVGDFRPYLNDEGEAGMLNTVDMNFHPNLGTGVFGYAYGIDSYVKDSLIMQLDGIVNTRSGHNAESTVWEDLVGSCNFTKTSNFSFGDNCILTTGIINSDNEMVVPAEYTFETVYQFDGTTYYGVGFSSQAPLFKGRPETQAPWWTRGSASENRVYYKDVFAINAAHSIAITQNADGGNCYHNGILSNTNSSVYSDASAQKLRNYSSAEILTGKIFAIRLHNRALTDEELMRNYAIDKARFGLEEAATATVSTLLLDDDEEQEV